MKALELLKEEGIKVISSVLGDEKDFTKKFLKGKAEEVSKPCSCECGENEVE